MVRPAVYGSTVPSDPCSARPRSRSPRSHQPEGPEFLREIRVRHIVEAVLRERLLLRLLVYLDHCLDLVPPELVVEARVRQFRVEGPDVPGGEGVRRELVVEDVARSDADELCG